MRYRERHPDLDMVAGGHPMKRIEMNVASCGECPWLRDTSDTACRDGQDEMCYMLHVYVTSPGAILPDCPLPDAPAESPGTAPWVIPGIHIPKTNSALG